MKKFTLGDASENAAADSTFQLAYGGPNVAHGSMSVRELAPALAAFNEFIELSNEILNGEKSKIELRVLGDFESGSFDVNFLVHHILTDPAAAMLPMLLPLSAKQIVDVAVGTYEKTKGIISGVAKVYKALHGERPKEIKNGDRNNTLIIVTGDNNTVVTDVNSAKLYGDDRVRNALTRTAEPLSGDGKNFMVLKRDNKVVETLENQDIGSIYLPKTVSDQASNNDSGTRDIWVRVVKPNFDGGRWSFHDGSAKFGAELGDSDFQAKVNRREQGFFKGDTFLIRLRSVQHLDKNGGLTTHNIVEKILDQREGARQEKLRMT